MGGHARGVQVILFHVKQPGALRSDHAQFDAARRQALIGVVGPQRQTELGAAGEHTIGLADTACD